MKMPEILYGILQMDRSKAVRQQNYLAWHSNKMLLWAEIQITCPELRQRLICLRRNMIPAPKERCVWDISWNPVNPARLNSHNHTFFS